MLRLMMAAWILAAPLGAQSVDGMVVNSASGVGIAGVTVYLVHGEEIAYSAISDSQGRFRIEPVKEGAYTWNYKAPDFLSSRYDRREQRLRVAGGVEPARLEIRLVPTCKVSGRVLDASGTAVPNAIVWLRLATPSGAQTFPLKTGETGQYSKFEGLPSGTLLVAAMAPASWKPPEPRDGHKRGWALTFYPDASDSALASKIPLAPGAEISNLDIKLAAEPVHRIRGTVLDLRGDPVAKASVALGGGVADSQVLTQDSDADGTFEFASVLDGEWGVSTTVNRDGVRLWAGQRVHVEGQDLDKVELRLAAPFSIHGKVVSEAPEGSPALPQLGVMVNYNEDRARAELIPAAALFPDFGMGAAAPDGKEGFIIRNLYPGPYLVDVAWATPPYYLDSVRLGGRDLPAANVRILSGDEPLIVTYKMHGGSVRGMVEGCSGGEVLLIPEDPGLRRYDLIQQATCGQNGRYEIPAVRPGEYYGFAVPAGDPINRFSVTLDQTLINQSVRVTVRANETTSADLHLIRQTTPTDHFPHPLP